MQLLTENYKPNQIDSVLLRQELFNWLKEKQLNAKQACELLKSTSHAIEETAMHELL